MHTAGNAVTSRHFLNQLFNKRCNTGRCARMLNSLNTDFGVPVVQRKDGADVSTSRVITFAAQGEKGRGVTDARYIHTQYRPSMTPILHSSSIGTLCESNKRPIAYMEWLGTYTTDADSVFIPSFSMAHTGLTQGARKPDKQQGSHGWNGKRQRMGVRRQQQCVHLSKIAETCVTFDANRPTVGSLVTVCVLRGKASLPRC